MTKSDESYKSRAPIAEILWEDAWVEVKDFPTEEAASFKPIIRSTVGYLIEETEECVIIATDLYVEKGMANTPMIIPWSAILGYWEFEVH
jgi:hypothetical protein